MDNFSHKSPGRTPINKHVATRMKPEQDAHRNEHNGEKFFDLPSSIASTTYSTALVVTGKDASSFNLDPSEPCFIGGSTRQRGHWRLACGFHAGTPSGPLFTHRLLASTEDCEQLHKWNVLACSTIIPSTCSTELDRAGAKFCLVFNMF